MEVFNRYKSLFRVVLMRAISMTKIYFNLTPYPILLTFIIKNPLMRRLNSLTQNQTVQNRIKRSSG